MATFRVVYSDNSPAIHTKVTISVYGGGTTAGFTDNRGYVCMPTSGTRIFRISKAR